MKSKYKSEAELCHEFMEVARACGWICYPECSNWDILLVRDGIQIGIQAKMSWNIEVVGQCCPLGISEPKRGPNFRAILVPAIPKHKKGWSSAPFRVTKRLKIWVIAGSGFGSAILDRNLSQALVSGFEWSPRELEWTPDYVPDLPAGVPSPLVLSQWKQAAMKVIATGVAKGFLTTDDFKEYDVNYKRFVDMGWIVEDGKLGRKNKYVLGHSEGRPDERHPEYYKKIEADVLASLNTQGLAAADAHVPL